MFCRVYDSIKNMRFDIITIFPNIFDSYFNESMIKRARAKKLVDIRIHDLRKFSRDKHKKVDDRPYGGGPGMVLKAEPILRAIEWLLKPSISKSKFLISKQSLNSKLKILIVLFSPAGKQFDQKMSRELAGKPVHEGLGNLRGRTDLAFSRLEVEDLAKITHYAMLHGRNEERLLLSLRGICSCR